MITTYSVRIEVSTGDEYVWADVSRILSGYGAVVKFTPVFKGGFFIGHSVDDPKTKALIIAPSPKWKGDIENEGWVIEQDFTPTE